MYIQLDSSDLLELAKRIIKNIEVCSQYIGEVDTNYNGIDLRITYTYDDEYGIYIDDVRNIHDLTNENTLITFDRDTADRATDYALRAAQKEWQRV